MRPVRRLLCFVLLLALVGTGAALAARGDPQKKVTTADQARAKAMLLRKADFAPGVKATPPSRNESDFYCEALDESDLTLTGEAESPDFGTTPFFVTSLASVYRSVSDSNTSWRRGTSAAGVNCAAGEFRRLAREERWQFVSLKRISFPRLAKRSVAYRVVFTVPVGNERGRITIDLIALQDGRAQAALFYGAVVLAPPKADEVALARIIAGRMAKAMRGA